MRGTRETEDVRLIDQVAIHGHLMVEVRPALYACERCGLAAVVHPDRSPIRELNLMLTLWERPCR